MAILQLRNKEIGKIIHDREYISSLFKNLLHILPSFDITDKTILPFDKDYLVVFSPQFMPIYVNPRNDKIQATYHHDTVLRTRKEFLELLKAHSTSITLA